MIKDFVRLRIGQLIGFFGLCLGLVVLYQNCGSQMQSAPGAPDFDAKALGSLEEVRALSFGPQVEAAQDGAIPGGENIELELASGKLNHEKDGVRKDCVADAGSLSELRALLDKPQICVPEAKPETVYCMMYVYADIKLSGVEANGQPKEYLLRAPSCAGGVFLCNPTEDSRLRELLTRMARQGC